jgi:phage repressor protein C with HTH and peptisase S24 domain
MLFNDTKQSITHVIDNFVITLGMETLGPRIKRRREELGLDQSELAKKVGFSQPALAKLEAGKNARSRFVAEIARELKTSVEWLTTGADEPTAGSAGDERRTEIRRDSDRPTSIYAIPPGRFREVPVIGKGSGGLTNRMWDDGGYPTGVSDQFADIATQDPNAFITSVEGPSMSPRYNPGEFALVEPNTEPEIEDDVLVMFKDHGPCIKRLLSKRGGFVRLGSYNTPDIITRPMEDVVWMYYVAHPVPARKIKSRT